MRVIFCAVMLALILSHHASLATTVSDFQLRQMRRSQMTPEDRAQSDTEEFVQKIRVIIQKMEVMLSNLSRALEAMSEHPNQEIHVQLSSGEIIKNPSREILEREQSLVSRDLRDRREVLKSFEPSPDVTQEELVVLPVEQGRAMLERASETIDLIMQLRR